MLLPPAGDHAWPEAVCPSLLILSFIAMANQGLSNKVRKREAFLPLWREAGGPKRGVKSEQKRQRTPIFFENIRQLTNWPCRPANFCRN
jgi:hypothetical protein